MHATWNCNMQSLRTSRNTCYVRSRSWKSTIVYAHVYSVTSGVTTSRLVQHRCSVANWPEWAMWWRDGWPDKNGIREDRQSTLDSSPPSSSRPPLPTPSPFSFFPLPLSPVSLLYPLSSHTTSYNLHNETHSILVTVQWRMRYNSHTYIIIIIALVHVYVHSKTQGTTLVRQTHVMKILGVDPWVQST